MTIGIDIRFLARGIQSGVEEYTLNLLPRLFDLGKSLNFKLFYNAFRKRKLDCPWINLPNVKLCQFSIPNRFLQISSFFFGQPMIDKLVGGVDVFFSPHFIFAPVSKKVKKIITFHDLSFEYYPEFFSLQRKIWHKLMRPKIQAGLADKIIAVSNSTKEDLFNLYKVAPEKVEVIYPGIGEEFRKVGKAEMERVAKKYNLFTPHRPANGGAGAGPEKFILYFGTIEPRKNIVGIIKAFELLKPDAKLVIAGAAGWLCKDVYKAAKNSSIAKDIIFTGFIDKDDKPALYNLAEVFLYPSFFEGFGFPPLEAMACGVPTIVSNTTSLPEVCGEAAFMVNPYDVNEIAEAIDEVLKNEELKKQMRDRGLSLSKKFDWQTCVKKTLKILTEI